VLIWNGDILLEYAIAALIVLPFLTSSTRVLSTIVRSGCGGIPTDQ
jgi:uncharacterized membrane protein YeiB